MSAQSSYVDAPAIGYSGTLDQTSPSTTMTAKNVEVTASMGFGKAVVFKTSSPVSDLDVLLPAAQTDKVAGIVLKADTYDRVWTDDAGGTHGQLDSTGLITGTVMTLVRSGRMLVTAAVAVAPGDRLYVRNAGGTLGALENASDSTNMIDCTGQGQWMSTAAIGGLAWLEFDFRNKQ